MAKWGKAGTAALLFAVWTSATVSADSEEGMKNAKLERVYHIYSEDQYLGTVQDKDKVDELIEMKVAETKAAFGDFVYETEEAFHIVPERVFEPKTTDEQTLLKQLESAVSIHARAFQVSVDGKPAVYLKDREAYDAMLRELQLKYVEENELKAWEESLEKGKASAELAEGQNRITEITLTESLSGSTEETVPQFVMTPEEAAAYLTTGKRTYTSVEGDTAETIAKAFGLQTERLSQLNKLPESGQLTEPLKPGSVLNVSAEAPFLKVEVVRETKISEALPYRSTEQKDASLFEGETKVVQKGQDGKVAVIQETREENGEVVRDRITDEQTVTEPVEEIIAYGTKDRPVAANTDEIKFPDAEVQSEAFSFAWPAEGGWISSEMGERWGEFHRGIDIARPEGFSIRAAADGVVVAAGSQGTYGNRVILDHGNGYRTVYAHLAKINVEPGMAISQGAELGIMGSTGRSTGTHLHFEILKDGTNINPLDHVDPS